MSAPTIGEVIHEKKPDVEFLDPVLEVNENVTHDQDEVHDHPLEKFDFEEISPKIFSLKDVKEPLTCESLNNALYEVGVVSLCWPEIEDPVFESRTCFPESYYTNNNKEKLLLAYAENFRRQYNLFFKNTLPLLFQAPNECGLQKMVCTSIRPTKICYTDTNTWQGLASLVADFFNYEPLTKPMLHPERIMSPFTALVRRSGNTFEIAHVLVSWLVGAGYDAYVVVGCAKRDVCMGIRYRTTCPELPDEAEVIEEPPEEEEEQRYKLMPLPDFTSKYIKETEAKESKKRQDKLDEIAAKKQKKIDELEQPPPDDIDGWRIHGWVLILPGPMGIEEPFFIEPSEGNAFPVTDPRYQRLDSVYNHENYYVNLQNCKEGLGNLNYDLGELTCWEHLLAGEPFARRVMPGVDPRDKNTAVDTEKHLDMPVSWVEKLELSANEFEQRYPGCYKLIHYKKVLVEKFSPYSERDGIVKRIKVYEDYALTKHLVTYEWYENRIDKLETIRIDYVRKEIKEMFSVGRKDHIIKHTYAMDSLAGSVEANRVIEFNYYARLDHLTKIVCTPLTFDEYYTDRDDRLETRFIVYSPGNKMSAKRQLLDITETFSRNHDIPAAKDVWKRVFHIKEDGIQLLHHYDYNFITNDTRHYIKPNLAETGGKILYYPEKTSGYIANPIALMPRPLDVYYGLCENMDWENKTRKHIRDRETDVAGYLRDRHNELTVPELFVALFDTERNEAAKKGWREQELQKAEVTVRETEAEIDPLAPYIARLFGSERSSTTPLSLKEATLVREQCLNDFKANQLARQNLVQDRFVKLNAEYTEKRLWYLANQFILTPEKETKYFQQSAELFFQVHALEVRLTRHQELSHKRLNALEDILNRHPLLAEYTRHKLFYSRYGKLR